MMVRTIYAPKDSYEDVTRLKRYVPFLHSVHRMETVCANKSPFTLLGLVLNSDLSNRAPINCHCPIFF